MSNAEDFEWSTRFPFAPNWAGRLILLMKSLPIQLVGRAIALLPTLAWVMISGVVPLALAGMCGLKVPNSDAAGAILVFVVPFVTYGAIVVFRVRFRLARRHSREDENVVLAILDEVTFLGWGITVGVTQMFRPLNQLFMVPLRLVFGTPRAIRRTIFVLGIAVLLGFAWTMLPVKFVPWANQYGRGFVTSFSVGGLFIMAAALLLGLLLFFIIFFGFWAEMLALGGSLVLAVTMLRSELPSTVTQIFSPLVAWSQWIPPGIRPILGEGSDLHPYVSGPGDVSPFGLLSIALVFQGIPFALKKVNVKMLPGELAMSAEYRQKIDNSTGWWLRCTAFVVFFELPLTFALISRFTGLADPALPPVSDGAFVVYCLFAAFGWFSLYRLIRNRARAIERSNSFADGLTAYTRRCLA